MRTSEELPFDPDLVAELEAIDATLRGEAVDPSFAEIAELSVLLVAERPSLPAEVGAALDERVLGGPAPPPPARRRWGGRRLMWGSGAAALAAAGVAAVIVLSGQPAAHRNLNLTSGAAGSSAAVSVPSRTAAGTTTQAAASAPSHAGAVFGPSAPAVSSALPSPAGARKVIQSAQLQLQAAGNRIEAVAQELYDVVGQESGIVRNAQVTQGGPGGGFASFSLSIPSGNLAATLTRLSELRYARVSSSTSAVQDVNDRYQSDLRALQDARALRTSLLRQLANATTQTQIDSLNAQIHDAEASISSDEATLRGLQQQISFTNVLVQINPGVIGPVPAVGSSTGFTLHGAAHDALRVLTVAAGVALIALAVLVPLGLAAAVVAWVAVRVRRRRREHALDAA